MPRGYVMPAAQARVATDRPARYLVQLCRHIDKRRRHPWSARPPRPHPGGTNGRPAHPAPQGEARAEWSGGRGAIDFGWGRCTLEADKAGNALVLRAEADDAEKLRHLQNLLTMHLARFSRREPLTTAWTPEPPAA